MIKHCIWIVVESHCSKTYCDSLLTFSLFRLQLEQNRIDGEKTVIQNPTEAQRKEHDKYDFDLHEVYAIDVLISTGEGQGTQSFNNTITPHYN